MQTLKDIQHHFQQSLLLEKEQLNLDFISSTQANERFAVYRQNLFENLRNALAITFPGIWILLGEECANNIAYAFIKQLKNLPITGCLDDWGYEWINFFETIPELNQLPYLKDVAMLEWFKHQSYCAEDAVNLELQALQNFSEDELNQLKFDFHPSVFLLHSRFPLQKIFEVIENPDAKSVDLSEEHAYVLIVRIENRVEIYWLEESEWCFLSALKQEQSLLEAYNEDDNFDLSKIIYFMFEKRMIRAVISEK